MQRGQLTGFLGFMAGFKTHLYGGMAAGAATSSFFILKDPSMFTSTQLSGIFLTGTIGGLLPDLDSDTSRPFSILFTLLSMIVPVLFFKEISTIWLYIKPMIEPFFVYISRFQPFELPLFSVTVTPFPSRLSPFPALENLTPEFIITYFALSYLVIRYGLCEVTKRITIHRGIMHSIPFALLCAEAGFLIFIPSGPAMATAVGISIFSGCIAHLLLDELNSITLKHGFIPKLKTSSGSAMKLKSDSIIATATVYLLAITAGVRVMTLMGIAP
ncbi:MAG: metal-dependent hydrolase [Desulfamplus sp.]|nr:metal-dependent hydrolase [Desulfamplus sp.]